MGDFLIYGATGYTGRLCVEQALSLGLCPVLAGRSADSLSLLAQQFGLQHRVFGLDDRAAVVKGLAGMTAVLHSAGPFSATARPMAEACLAAGVHYCDITGEIDVFEDLAGLDARAKAAGVMLMPGVGFDVVPSDCLAAHVVAMLPDTRRLRLSIGGLSRASRGTAKTMVEGIARGTRVRRGGRLTVARGTPRGTADFGWGPRPTVGVSWGDVSSAWYSTGVPDIEAFFEADPAMQAAATMPDVIKRVLGAGLMQRILKAQIDRRLPAGPSPEQRARGRACVVVEAWDGAARRVACRLTTPEPYALTARTAVEIVRRTAAGAAIPGFRTPSSVFGADFVMGFDGVARTNL